MMNGEQKSGNKEQESGNDKIVREVLTITEQGILRQALERKDISSDAISWIVSAIRQKVASETKVTWKIKGWIHPKQGGDDYQFTTEVITTGNTTEQQVREHMVKKLKRRSYAPDDFTITRVD